MESNGKTTIKGPTRKRLFCMSISLCVAVLVYVCTLDGSVYAGFYKTFASIVSLENLCFASGRTTTDGMRMCTHMQPTCTMNHDTLDDCRLCRQRQTTMPMVGTSRHCYRDGFALFFGYTPNRICITIFQTVIVSKTIKTVGTCALRHETTSTSFSSLRSPSLCSLTLTFFGLRSILFASETLFAPFVKSWKLRRLCVTLPLSHASASTLAVTTWHNAHANRWTLCVHRWLRIHLR